HSKCSTRSSSNTARMPMIRRLKNSGGDKNRSTGVDHDVPFQTLYMRVSGTFDAPAEPGSSSAQKRCTSPVGSATRKGSADVLSGLCEMLKSGVHPTTSPSAADTRDGDAIAARIWRMARDASRNLFAVEER